MNDFPEIGCVDCGGRCHALTARPLDEDDESTWIVAYRCTDCGDRWDVEIEADDTGAGSAPA